VSVRESEQLICDSDSVEHFALYIIDIEVFMIYRMILTTVS